jgi:ketosteroid isomerase-like protein
VPALPAPEREMTDRLQELLDRKAIRELKSRYFRTLDTKDWDGFRGVFADDASFQLLDVEPIEGADAFVEFTRTALDGTTTVHHGHTPQIAIESPTEASASWVLHDYVEWPSDPNGRRGIEGFGRYDETYRKVDGEWRIATWKLGYLRMDALPREPLPAVPLGGPDIVREDQARALATDPGSTAAAGGDAAQQLLDVEKISEVKARYFRLVDDQDWEAWRELFTDDFEVDLADGHHIEGADAWVDAVAGMTAAARTVHHGHMPEITIDGPDEAHGRWALADYLEWPADPESGDRHGVKGYGDEQETYRKEDGVWKIASMRLSYLRFDSLPRQPLPEKVAGL